VVAAFGDNLNAQAERLARSLALDARQTGALRELGNCLNYNAYGDAIADLAADPAVLYSRLHRYADPFAFMLSESLYGRIRTARDKDLDCAARLAQRLPSAVGEIMLLPDARWSRRVRGIYANQLARAAPARPHALLVVNANGAYTVSVRAPLEGKSALRGADRLCQQFERGGGRPAAASIAQLPGRQLPDFIRAFEAAFSETR
jgi:hypothetical protein